MNHPHPKAGELLLSDPIRMTSSPRRMADADRSNAAALAHFRANGGALVDMTTGKVVRHVSAAEARIHAGGSQISRPGARPLPAPQPKEDPAMQQLRDIANAVKAYAAPHRNKTEQCRLYLCAHQEGFTQKNFMTQNFEAGELARAIRMAEPAAPPAPAPSGDAPKPSAGNPIGALEQGLAKLAQVFADAFATNPEAAQAIVSTAVSNALPAIVDADGGVMTTMPRHLMGMPGPNLTEKARQYLCARLPGFAKRDGADQNFQAGEYLRSGAPVL